MSWCEQQQVDDVFGRAKNSRLWERIRKPPRKTQRRHAESGHAARLCSEFRYRTLHSWSRKRRVAAKAECPRKGKNPRFVVTSLPARQRKARSLYEDLYRARGEMENRIKEQQWDLFADRTSTALMRSNQIRACIFPRSPMACCAAFPVSQAGRASAISLSRPAQAYCALRPAGLLAQLSLDFVTRLPPGRLPGHAARQLPC